MTAIVDQPVLVLNRNWQPVAVSSVGVAVASVVREMAWVLHPETYEVLEWEPWCAQAPRGMRQVRTPSGSLPAPEVIVLRGYAGRPRLEVRFSRQNLYRRDGFVCQYCGGRPGVGGLTIDHVVPRSRGGGTTWENCVAACEPCNRRKADRTPAEARMPLRCTPRRPGGEAPVVQREVRPAWRSFVRAEAEAR